jgi:RNA polymerase sigma-70 factor, ECF subfamily
MADSNAFERIVDGHHAEIRRYLWRVIPDGADALCEETFVRAFRAHRSLTADADVRTWLFAIATRLCQTRRSARKSSLSKRESARPHVPDGRLPEREAWSFRRRGSLEAAIARLPGAPRAALVMRKLHHLDYAAIGACLDCSAETARTLVLEAMREIRRGVEGFPAEGDSHRGRDDRHDDRQHSISPDHLRGSRAGLAESATRASEPTVAWQRGLLEALLASRKDGRDLVAANDDEALLREERSASRDGG